ncbi:MAG: transposase [Patescibacteria group bacterium]|nr:transposase [Patescibacteria group bacterium]
MYFVTSRTIDGKRLFNTNQKMEIVIDRLRKSIIKYGINLYGWVVLMNHYHILFSLPRGKLLSSLTGFINGGSAHELNRLDGVKGRNIWWNYWDNCIRGEKDFYTRLNYIHHNPVKHGYVKANREYPYSSYNWYREKFGVEYINDLEMSYPVIDFTDKN